MKFYRNRKDAYENKTQNLVVIQFIFVRKKTFLFFDLSFKKDGTDNMFFCRREVTIQ